jgi:riboflavin kinase/FMN adenylyltransferase
VRGYGNHMELIRGIHNLQPRHRGCVATIGNFDGVHRGHQLVLEQVAHKAANLNLPSQIVIFEPLPREFFAGHHAPGRLTRFREKFQILAHLSVDRLLCLRFNRALANMPPDVFIERILVDGLGVHFLIVGDDFRFGKDRTGNYAMLKEAGGTYGFEVTSMHSFTIDGKRVSSTLIREALRYGDMEKAQQFLGRAYRISGRVMRGDKMGRKLGFPTANIRLARQVSPVHGVFASQIYGLPDEPMKGVVNIGCRPTLGGTEHRLEVHVLDFDGNLYGCHLHVDLLHKIRNETKFNSINALQDRIQRDVQSAREYFNSSIQH